MPWFSHLRAGTDPSHSLPTFLHRPCEKGEEHRGLIYLRPCSQPGPERAQCKARDARVRCLSPAGPTGVSPVSLSVISGLECPSSSRSPVLCVAGFSSFLRAGLKPLACSERPGSALLIKQPPTFFCLRVPIVFSRALVIICN